MRIPPYSFMKNIYVVLVHPKYKGNIGAVSRIMKNFNFENLRIVGKMPQKEDYALSVHAKDILSNVHNYNTLEDALVDLDKKIAITRRPANHKNFDFVPENLGTYQNRVSNQKIGIVFGRESYGLKGEEEDLCDLRCYIPSNPDFPSLNLSQAVSIILYEIYKNTNQFSSQDRKIKPASGKEINDNVAYILNCLKKIEFFDRDNHSQIAYIFRNTFIRANIGKKSLYKFKKIFERIMGIYFIKTGKKFK